MIHFHFCSSPQRVQKIMCRKLFASNVKMVTTSKSHWLRVSLSFTLIFTCPYIEEASNCPSYNLSVRLGTDCHQSCPDRTYSVKETMVCAPCDDKHCDICDQSQCYWCNEGFYVFGNIWTIFNLGLSLLDMIDSIGHCTLRSWHFTRNNSFNVTVLFSQSLTTPHVWGNCYLDLILI